MNETETWIAAEAVSSRVGLPVVSSPSGRLICNVNCVTDKTFGKQPGDDAFNREALRHAKLIAAAPALLAALTELIEWVETSEPEFTQDDDWEESQARIYAALNKAGAA